MTDLIQIDSNNNWRVGKVVFDGCMRFLFKLKRSGIYVIFIDSVFFGKT